MGDNVTVVYLALLAVTAGLCVVQIYLSLRSPEERLGLPLIFCLAFLYFYVVQSYYAVTTLGQHLSSWMFEYGQLTALLGLSAFLYGWRVGRKPGRFSQRGPAAPLSELTAYMCGLVGMAVGLVGAWSIQLDGKTVLKETSAYLYLLFHLSYPGVLICLQMAARNRMLRSPVLLAPPLFLLAATVAPAVINARRGPMFPMTIVILYGYALSLGKRINPLVLVGGLVGTGFVMLLFVTVRDYSAVGGSWSSKNFEQLDASKVLLTKATQLDDNEFIFHCAVSATCWVTGASDYGSGYVTLITHWIPRQWWPDKPMLGEGFAGDDVIAYLPSVVGFDLSGGASTGGIGETYSHLGPFALVLWWGFGYLCGVLYTRCLQTRSVQAQAAYIAVAASSHWLVSQGFAAAFVPGMIYIGFPLAVYTLSRQTAD